MSATAPGSPGAPHVEEDDDDEAPDAGEAAAAPVEEGEEKSGGQGGEEGGPNTKRMLWLSYAKNYHLVNLNHVIIDQNKPFLVADGNQMFLLHESKSFKVWENEYCVRARNIIKVKAGGICCWYICFKVEGADSADSYVMRNIHKSIARRFFQQWHKDWPEERKQKYAELLRDEPSDTPQILPGSVGWGNAESSPGGGKVLYKRPPKPPKAKEGAAAPLSGAIGKGAASHKKLAQAAAAAAAAADFDDDDQSSTAQSAPPPTPVETSMVGFRPQQHQPAMMASAPQIFLHTPGTVTVSEAWLQQLIANQRQ